MGAHEVSKGVNNPKYDAPDCCAPVGESLGRELRVRLA